MLYTFQDTVVALQALSIFGGMTFTGDIDLSVVAQGYEEDIQINVNRGNSLIYQSKDISVKENELSIATSGLGCALVQVGRFS